MVQERSAEAPGFVPEKQKCTCFVTAATAVQKLLAALRYLWGLRSAMAESSRGKLVLFFFFFLTLFYFFLNCISDMKTRTHTSCNTSWESAGACVSFCIRGLPVLYSFIHIQYLYIYIFKYIYNMWVCFVSGVWGFGKERSKCFWIEDYRPADSRKRDSRSLRGIGRTRADEVRLQRRGRWGGRRLSGEEGMERGRDKRWGFTSWSRSWFRIHFPRSSVLKFSQFLNILHNNSWQSSNLSVGSLHRKDPPSVY